MERQVPYLESNAAFKVLLPILGLLGGLAFGWLRAWITGATELEFLAILISHGIIGSALGMGAVLASVYPIRSPKLRSLRSLAILVLVVALVVWFVLTLVTPVFHSRQG